MNQDKVDQSLVPVNFVLVSATTDKRNVLSNKMRRRSAGRQTTHHLSSLKMKKNSLFLHLKAFQTASGHSLGNASAGHGVWAPKKNLRSLICFLLLLHHLLITQLFVKQLLISSLPADLVLLFCLIFFFVHQNTILTDDGIGND